MSNFAAVVLTTTDRNRALAALDIERKMKRSLLEPNPKRDAWERRWQQHMREELVWGVH